MSLTIHTIGKFFLPKPAALYRCPKMRKDIFQFCYGVVLQNLANEKGFDALVLHQIKRFVGRFQKAHIG